MSRVLVVDVDRALAGPLGIDLRAHSHEGTGLHDGWGAPNRVAHVHPALVIQDQDIVSTCGSRSSRQPPVCRCRRVSFDELPWSQWSRTNSETRPPRSSTGLEYSK